MRNITVRPAYRALEDFASAVFKATHGCGKICRVQVDIITFDAIGGDSDTENEVVIDTQAGSIEVRCV